MNGNADIIRRNPVLAQKARETESNVEGLLNNIQRNSDRLALNASNLNQFLGPGSQSEGLSDKYDLEKLKSSDEFTYTVHAILRNMRVTLTFDKRITESLEDFLTVLEEYE